VYVGVSYAFFSIKSTYLSKKKNVILLKDV